MKAFDWGNRIAHRSDISKGLVHLTKGNGEMDAFHILMKIIKEKKLIGSENKTVNGQQRGFVCGDDAVVCFQDVPLISLSENILLEQEMRAQNPSLPVRYEAFGLRFDKRYVFQNGGRPVFYEKTDVAKKLLPHDEYWRIVKLDLDYDKYLIDWTHEREWRIKGDFNFELNQVELILSDQDSFGKLFEFCSKEGMLYIFKEIKSVTTLSSLVL